MSVTVREAAGVGATVSGVTLTATTTGGASAVSQFLPALVFGTARIAANGTLVSANISTAGQLLAMNAMTLRIAFTDDGGQVGAAEATATVKLDLSGDWSGPLPIRTQPSGDWSSARMVLTQGAADLGGDLTSRDGVRFPLTGSVSGDWAPMLSLGGLPGTSTCGGVGLAITQILFSGGRAQHLLGSATGRCFGTIAGTFDLQRVG